MDSEELENLKELEALEKLEKEELENIDNNEDQILRKYIKIPIICYKTKEFL